jgi:protein-S-isoprenylcysteine O-methyltransferase Ste14
MTNRRESRNPARFLMHVPVPWVFVLTYFLGVAIEMLRRPGIRWVEGSGAAGGVLFAIGAVIAGWSLLIFHRKQTTTIPGRTSAALVTWGPYSFSRNPMYVGLTCAYLGEAGMLQQIWPVVLLPLTIAYLNWIVIPVEEGRLTEVFGRAYDDYRTRVRRWI